MPLRERGSRFKTNEKKLQKATRLIRLGEKTTVDVTSGNRSVISEGTRSIFWVFVCSLLKYISGGAPGGH
jgi:hypothetical protein